MGAKVNIVIDQGADLNKVIYRLRTTTGAPIDLSGATGFASLKVNYRAPQSYDIPTVTLTANGEVILVANAAFTASVPAGRYVYDVLMTNGAGSTRLVEGYCAVEPAVSSLRNGGGGKIE